MANRATVDTYTVRNRRQNYEEVPRQKGPTRFASAAVKAAPAPRPAEPPAPFGDLSTATIAELCDLSGDLLPGQSRPVVARRQTGIRLLFSHLETLPGNTWQDRWEASGFNAANAPSVNTLGRPEVRDEGSTVVSALKMMFVARGIQPSLSGFRANTFLEYADFFQKVRKDPQLEAAFAMADAQQQLRAVHRHRAKFDIACALTTQGIDLVDLTPAALLHYSLENKRLGLTHGANKDTTRFAALGAWEVLHKMGHFPPGTAPTLRTFIYNGQRSVEELVDQYGINNAGIRQLLIDYLVRRKSDTDYITLAGLARHLASTFWSVVEQLNPDQKDLDLGQDLYDQWRAELQYWRKDGKTDRTRIRKDAASVLLSVRGLYIDLHSWAIAEPERWAQWVTPCPILPRDLKGFGKRRREVSQRMADRTRVRQPLLPVLVNHVEARYEHLVSLLDAAGPLPLGEIFEHQGRTYRRSQSREDQRRAKSHAESSVRVIAQDNGEVINVTLAEDSAFWEWAAVEILRHSGIRIEELVELTHLSIRQYQRPNGEVIALLVVAPSKSERERVIPMSAELFHAIAQIIRRQTRDGQAIPLVTRYDGHEKTWSEPMPFLFQRQIGTLRGVLAPTTVLGMLSRSCKQIAETNAAFAGTKFTPHDFRRLFATEIVNGGLPIHIGAALLGHLNLQTTQGYVAVFAEDIVQHYQEFLNHRRAQRPEGEYVDVTPEEWADFEEHFDKRKVELGNCARPYGSPCQHEHACIRCPMLQVNPKMLPRLAEIEKDLLLRRKRAEEEQWLGEIEGIDMTLTFVRTKQADAARLTRRTPVALGIPTSRPTS
ncbi:site-specific integrase [Streptomyces sp. NBC_00513]|uniref:site-specific integrase n=1 Tax=unclassified Streptomyces TaxID=2593676 RepID=UPI00224F6037|nr:site-specific integrase [Streptomyces sp. NBC_00424]MCX5072691.1 site-specific integrase [Streptomyces sp. NBC_00424]MCX5073110.1 site-specific integrase [Streptomyces sp. NBC_00424]WUD43606.1 site-specific integrase [Streptomyces sp. NBC_00513]WUD43992.1 site-specific integrase [Streptomyces sp. NBC_00513]